MSSRTRRSPEYGSDLIVDLLTALDVEYAALNPGATFRGLHDSLVNYGGNARPEIIQCCHEEIAVAVAHGYGKAKGQPMAAIVHDVVGLLHATMAVYIAWLDRAPALVLGATGPMAAEQRRPWIDWIHTALVQGQAVRDYVKWDDQPASLESIVESLIRAHRITMTEPRGPVYLCFDAMLQEQRLDGPPPIPDVRRFGPPARAQGDPRALEVAARWLVEAADPVVLADYAGRSAGAVASLVELAELLALPVIDLGSRFNFPNTHPLDLAGAEEDLLSAADLVLALDVFDLQKALGTVDRTARQARPFVRDGTKIIHVSLDDLAVRAWTQDYGRLQPVDLAIAADTTVVLPALTALCRPLVLAGGEREGRRRERRARLEAVRRALRDRWRRAADRARDARPVSFPRLAADLWDVVKDEDWVLVNRTLRGWTRRLWDWTHPSQYVGALNGGGVGYGIGHAMGAALAHRGTGRLCIDIQPDGDCLYTPSALWTAAHHRIPLLIVMFNNRSYYNDEDHQVLMAKARGRPVENAHIGLRLDDPPVDFAGMARAFGIHADGPIEDPAELHPALARAVRHVQRERRPALIDVITEAR
ncbi:MAG TPA: thiamine pyrophosphate-dependent enzyme [bacterium]|nr:thiamine pyrophosphate-dependent enzyme [bacterium]